MEIVNFLRTVATLAFAVYGISPRDRIPNLQHKFMTDSNLQMSALDQIFPNIDEWKQDNYTWITNSLLYYRSIEVTSPSDEQNSSKQNVDELSELNHALRCNLFTDAQQNHIYVVFRGTDNLYNVVHDFAFGQTVRNI